MQGAVTGDALDIEGANGNAVIRGNKITAKAGAATGIAVTAGGSLTMIGNNVSILGGSPSTTAVALTGASGDPQIIENNIFGTAGLGNGLAFSGGELVALVQGNSFQNNFIGVAITGDGTNAGDIDLGGGLLGSLGKNNFSGFTGVVGHYAITLNNTSDFAAIDALHNIFTTANPAAVVQDELDGGAGSIVL